jgi:hypothetical protein
VLAVLVVLAAAVRQELKAQIRYFHQLLQQAAASVKVIRVQSVQVVLAAVVEVSQAIPAVQEILHQPRRLKEMQAALEIQTHQLTVLAAEAVAVESVVMAEVHSLVLVALELRHLSQVHR